MKRRRMFQVFKAAADAGNYADLPELPLNVDPQVYLSRNSVPQPFYLVCGKDSVVVQTSGEALVRLKESTVNTFKLVPGDHVYVPAGTPHQIVPVTESVQLRYKAPHAGMEGVAWYCHNCDNELARAEWDTEVVVPQRAYVETCEAFNASDSLRHCSRCGHDHPLIQMELFAAWHDVAAGLEEERAAAKDKAAAGAAPA